MEQLSFLRRRGRAGDQMNYQNTDKACLISNSIIINNRLVTNFTWMFYRTCSIT
jgi:hypothetical protein